MQRDAEALQGGLEPDRAALGVTGIKQLARVSALFRDGAGSPASAAARTSLGLILLPGLALVPGTHRPRSSRAMKISYIFLERYTEDDTPSGAGRECPTCDGQRPADDRALPPSRKATTTHQS
jgi:hypothetical protein